MTLVNRLQFLDEVVTRIPLDGDEEVVHLIKGYMASRDMYNLEAHLINNTTGEQRLISKYDSPAEHILEALAPESLEGTPGTFIIR